MRVDTLVANQLLMAQSVDALADHIANSTGFALTPVTFANLPATPAAGMIGCISDSPIPSNSGAFSQIVTVGGGSNTQLVFYNGTHWTVFGV